MPYGSIKLCCAKRADSLMEILRQFHIIGIAALRATHIGPNISFTKEDDIE